MDIKVPKPLKAEHKELHGELLAATKAGGKVGEAAKSVEQILHPHFVKEEEYALPPLGLLTILAESRLPSDIPAIITMTDKLKMDLNLMLHEHKAVIAALHKLMVVAENDRMPEVVHLAEKLKLHAQMEEEVLYPAAILIGEYLKLKTGPIK
jgi:hypothetical protein